MADGNYTKETMSFTDEYGNPMSIDLQSVRNTSDREFMGYLVTPMNSESDNNNQFRKNAVRYFKEHPGELQTVPMMKNVSMQQFLANPDQYANRLLVDYAEIQLGKHVRNMIDAECASPLMYAYIDQQTRLAERRPDDDGHFYSWEELTGEKPLPAGTPKVKYTVSEERLMIASNREVAVRQGQFDERVDQRNDQYSGTIVRIGLETPKQQPSPTQSQEKPSEETQPRRRVKMSPELMKRLGMNENNR